MSKLTLIPLAGLAMMLALVLGACKPNPAGAGHGDTSGVSTREVCDQIHNAIDNGTLDSHLSETTIKLAAARDGVPETIRNAIDSYYRGDHAAGRQAMLVACANAGHPVRS